MNTLGVFVAKFCQFCLWAAALYSSDEIKDVLCHCVWHKWRHRASALCGQPSAIFSMTKNLLERILIALHSCTPHRARACSSHHMDGVAFPQTLKLPVLLIHKHWVFLDNPFLLSHLSRQNTKSLWGVYSVKIMRKRKSPYITDSCSLPLWLFPGLFAMYGCRIIPARRAHRPFPDQKVHAFPQDWWIHTYL